MSPGRFRKLEEFLSTRSDQEMKSLVQRAVALADQSGKIRVAASNDSPREPETGRKGLPPPR